MNKIECILLNKISQIIYDKKGFNIVAIDVQEISSFTDYFLVAEGNVDRHLKAISQEIIESLKEFNESPAYVEESDNWIVVDYITIVIHLFTPQIRDLYRLEEVWKNGKIVDLKIDIDHNRHI